MKKVFSLAILALLTLSVLPTIMAVSVGTGIGIDVTTEEFAPLIWQCDSRVIWEDCVEEGREGKCEFDQFVWDQDGQVSDGDNGVLSERIENYAFEGEQIQWKVLVMDKNKIEEIQDVVATIGDVQGVGNDIEVECARSTWQPEQIPNSCEARILEEKLTEFDPDTMAFYECVFTVETPESMYGEYFLTVEAISVDGEATMDENEYWFLNPIIALTVDGDVEFEDVRPGTVSYSSTILVGNDADEGSGVLMDMFISGTDFYDPIDSGAKCPTTNQLKLSNNIRSQASIQDQGSGTDYSAPHHDLDCQAGVEGLDTHNADHLCYYATNGAYSTAYAANADAEGYVPIVYGDIFSRDFYNDAEIISQGENDGVLEINGIDYHAGNVLSPGAEIALNFKLGMPEPCVGDFSTGDIFFWGEAI